MAPRLSLAALPAGLVTLMLLSAQCAAQTYVSGTFQAAVWAQGGQLQSAAQVQCPAGYPTSCGSIGEPDYCCPSSFTCAYTTNKVVGCCPSGQTCSGSIGGSGGYQPSSWYSSTCVAPTTYQTYYTPPATTTNYGGVIVGGAAATTVYQYPTTTHPATTVIYAGNFCTTITAVGPNLPTTAGVACGVALIVAPSEGRREGVGWSVLGVVLGMQALGGLVLGWRR
nr:hypothetical protein B0A51_12324 [Rachicladosporium sp. CCFEE 5018]OQO19590.1 hypothetical protein B0A51_14132 [Rachicladosporium sp. CCFEE 5018]